MLIANKRQYLIYYDTVAVLYFKTNFKTQGNWNSFE